MPTIKKEVNDETVELEVTDEDLPSDYNLLKQNELNENYVEKDYHEKETQRIRERFENRNLDEAKRELRRDNDFIEEVLEEHGEETKRVQELQAEKESLESKLEEYENKYKNLDSKIKSQTVREAAKNAGIDERFLEAPEDGVDPYIENVVMEKYELEEADESKMILKEKESGERVPAPTDADETFMSVDTYLSSDKFEEYRSNTEPTSGSGFEENGSSSSVTPSTDNWKDLGKDEKLQAIRENDGKHPKYE